MFCKHDIIHAPNNSVHVGKEDTNECRYGTVEMKYTYFV